MQNSVSPNRFSKEDVLECAILIVMLLAFVFGK
jgi:hypothetical protein